MNKISVVFESDGLRLVGSLISPPMTGVHPALLCLHGAGHGNKERYDRLQVSLASHGYASLAFDFRGCGQSQGKFEDSSLENRLRDSQRAYQFLINQKNIDSSRVCIIGSSMGGYVATRLLSFIPNPSALILLYPAAYAPESEKVPLNEKFTKIIRQPHSWKHSLSLDAIDGYPGPVYVVYGSKEEIIPIDIQKRYQKRAIKKGASHVIKDAPHTLLKYVSKEEKDIYQDLTKRIVKFLTIWVPPA